MAVSEIDQFSTNKALESITQHQNFWERIMQHQHCLECTMQHPKCLGIDLQHSLLWIKYWKQHQHWPVIDHAIPIFLESIMQSRCFTPCHGRNSMFRNYLFKRFRRRLFCIVIEGEYCKIARCKFFNKYPFLNGHFTLNCPQSTGCKVNNLKVLSSEMDPAEIRLIQ